MLFMYKLPHIVRLQDQLVSFSALTLLVWSCDL